MIQKDFDKIKMEHGCGYYNICSIHECPCNIAKEKEYKEDVKYYIKDMEEDILNEIEEDDKRQYEKEVKKEEQERQEQEKVYDELLRQELNISEEEWYGV